MNRIKDLLMENSEGNTIVSTLGAAAAGTIAGIGAYALGQNITEASEKEALYNKVRVRKDKYM